MSDPSTPENPTADGSAVDGAASASPTADASLTVPAADPAPAAPAEAPRFIQPYPGAPPIPAASAPQRPAAQLPPYAAPAGYPGAPTGQYAAPSAAQDTAPSGQYTPAGQYAPPAGQYTAPTAQYGAPTGQYAPPAGSYPPPGGTYPPAGSGTPSAPDTRPKTLAIIALCLAIFGAIVAFVPFVNLLAAPILIAAIVLAIIALVSKKQGGTGLSIAALIVSVLSGLASIIIAVVSIFLVTLGGLGAFDDAVPDDTYSEPYSNGDGTGDGEAVYGAGQELEVVETAFGDAGLGDGTWWYAVVIDNPNADAVFDYEDLTVTALDASGVELQTNDEYLTIMPGTTALTGYFETIGGAQISELEVDLPDAETGYIVDPADLGALTVGDVSASSDGSTTTVTGTVTSTFVDDSEYVFISVLARDASGAIVSVATGMADSVPAGESAAFDASFYPALADGVTVEAYAVL
jgi:hypothetical protein